MAAERGRAASREWAERQKVRALKGGKEKEKIETREENDADAVVDAVA